MECVLRNWRMEDAAALAGIIGNRHIQDNLRDGIPFPYTEADARAFLREMMAADPDRLFAFAVEAEGRLVGSIVLTRGQNVHSRTAEVGYYIAESCWGKGVGTAALRQACEWVFAQTDILRIYAEPYAFNAASCRILEKAGFSLEGIMRAHAFKNGRVLDMKLYARIREE